jgi:D-methionine transport system substrate-binding protein
VDAAVINTNYALEAKLVPTKDALAIESADSPYVNILAVRKGDENRPELKKLAEALNTPEVKKFIEDKYQGAVVPAF